MHAGYEPTRGEADTALAAVYDLEKFLFNRLAEKRTTYPRSTLMTLGKSGLERRSKWTKQIREFEATIAPKEANWFLSFKAYRAEVADGRAVQRSDPNA